MKGSKTIVNPLTGKGNESKEELFDSLMAEAKALEEDNKIRDAHKLIDTEDMDYYMLKQKETDLVLRKARLLDTRELNNTDYHFIIQVMPVDKDEVYEGGDGYSNNYFKLAMYVGDETLQNKEPNNPNVFSKAFITKPIMLSRVKDQLHDYLTEELVTGMKNFYENMENSEDEKDKLCVKYVNQYMQSISKDILKEVNYIKNEKNFAFLCNYAKDVTLDNKVFAYIDFQELNDKYFDKDVKININKSKFEDCCLLRKADNIHINEDNCNLVWSEFVDTIDKESKMKTMRGLVAENNKYYIYADLPKDDSDYQSLEFKNKAIKFEVGSDITKIPAIVDVISKNFYNGLNSHSAHSSFNDISSAIYDDISSFRSNTKKVNFEYVDNEEADKVYASNKEKIEKICGNSQEISDIQILSLLAMQKKENLQHLSIIGSKESYDRGFIADAKSNYIGSVSSEGVFSVNDESKASMLVNATNYKSSIISREKREAMIQAEAISINPADFIQVLKNAKDITVDIRYGKEFEGCLSAIADTQKNNELVPMNQKQFEQLNVTLQENIRKQKIVREMKERLDELTKNIPHFKRQSVKTEKLQTVSERGI